MGDKIIGTSESVVIIRNDGSLALNTKELALVILDMAVTMRSSDKEDVINTAADIIGKSLAAMNEGARSVISEQLKQGFGLDFKIEIIPVEIPKSNERKNSVVYPIH